MFVVVMTVFATSVVWAAVFCVIVHYFSEAQKQSEEQYKTIHKQNIDAFCDSLVAAKDEFQAKLDQREEQWKDHVASLTGAKKAVVPSA
jgi:ABC-type transport system involved in cytochrome bd biosynthesis fused ATPase/permease subunit